MTLELETPRVSENKEITYQRPRPEEMKKILSIWKPGSETKDISWKFVPIIKKEVKKCSSEETITLNKPTLRLRQN